MFTEEQQETLINVCQRMKTQLENTASDLATASQTIVDQAALIKHLSEDNLKLVAKLDALTGKTAPGTNFSA